MPSSSTFTPFSFAAFFAAFFSASAFVFAFHAFKFHLHSFLFCSLLCSFLFGIGFRFRFSCLQVPPSLLSLLQPSLQLSFRHRLSFSLFMPSSSTFTPFSFAAFFAAFFSASAFV